MKIALGADHNGVDFKRVLIGRLRELGHEVIDVGPETTDSVDYPDYAFAVAERVADGRVDRGVLICGSGAGMSMAANKVRGVRAAVCLTPEAARLARGHNDANVLVLAGWQNDSGDLFEILDNFLGGEFDGGRHARRVDKIIAYENGER
jgi:ribose 5-phosphate isomerase B